MEKRQDYAKLLLTCEQEPIHIPGAIQPFGILLSVDWPNLEIRNASVNCIDAFGVSAPDLLGRSFAEFVSADQLQGLRQYIGQDNVREQAPLSVALQTFSTPRGQHGSHPEQRWELSAHRHAGCLILELEHSSDATADALSFHRKSRDAVQALQAATSLQELCEAAVQQVQSITGFDRVMLYQFTEEWHGKVIAEACAPHMHSYLGHHFPASDIPAQAHAVFLQNWLRMIPDVDYVPATIYPGVNPQNGAPLDLGNAALRSVSPIHLEYLRNMQVKATLTVSIVDQGKLWGLIACHHAAPRKLDADSRLGAKMVGQLVSSQLQLKQSLDEVHYRAQLRAVHKQLLSYMEREEDLMQGLIRHTPNMLDLAASGGAAAAIHHDDKWAIIGKTPSPAQIEALVDWLAQSHGGENMFCTDRLSVHFPPAAQYKDVASGLLAVSIPKTERNYILWFRSEVATTVTWAGNPDKLVQQEGDNLTLHPRASFQSWQQIVAGVAAPWKKAEVEAITELRNTLLALDLQREFRREQTARARAERISREKENVVNMVSHDLRTPLSIIRMSLEVLQRTGKNAAGATQNLIERSLRATETIEQLTKDLLDMAKVDAGTLGLAVQMENAESLVQEAVDMARPLAGKNNLRLQARLNAHGADLLCDRARIAQVFSNLIGNALKFTPIGGDITVSIDTDEEKDMLVFCVADTGTGIAPEHLQRIFDRFWQEDRAKQQGTGLGLSIAKGIVEKHGGRIWADSTPGAGSRFFFSLPRKNGKD